MERLTYKEKGFYRPTKQGEWYTTPDDGSNACRLLQVIGKYEDLEEQIGCPLEVRCKIVLRALIYTDDGSDWIVQNVLDKYFWASCNTEYSNANFSWKDYKKTWWLKADRSE